MEKGVRASGGRGLLKWWQMDTLRALPWRGREEGRVSVRWWLMML